MKKIFRARCPHAHTHDHAYMRKMTAQESWPYYGCGKELFHLYYGLSSHFMLNMPQPTGELPQCWCSLCVALHSKCMLQNFLGVVGFIGKALASFEVALAMFTVDAG